jgi:hypothetical protein
MFFDKPKPDFGKVGLVLAGGGYRGVNHIGFLEALAERGVHKNLVYFYGVSVSAIQGFVLSQARKPGEFPKILKKIKKHFLGIEKEGPGAIFNFGIVTFFKALSGDGDGILQSDCLLELFEEVDVQRSLDSYFTFEFGVQSRRTGRKRIISNKSPDFRHDMQALVRAVIGSASLPPIFGPVDVLDDKFSDGFSIYMGGAVKRCDTIFVLFPYPAKYIPSSRQERSLGLPISIPNWYWNFVDQYEIQVREANFEILSCALNNAKRDSGPRIISVFADDSPETLQTSYFRTKTNGGSGDITSALTSSFRTMEGVLGGGRVRFRA